LGPSPSLTPPLATPECLYNLSGYVHNQNKSYKRSRIRRRHIYFSTEKLCDPASWHLIGTRCTFRL